MKNRPSRIQAERLPQRHTPVITPCRILVSDILLAVSSYYGVRLADLTASTRERPIAWPRMMAMKLAYELTGLSYPALGPHFGGRDHSTIMYGHRMATVWQRTSPVVAYDVAKLTQIAELYRDSRLHRLRARGLAPLFLEGVA